MKVNALRPRNMRIAEADNPGGLEGNITSHRYLRDGGGSAGVLGDDMLRDGGSVNLGDLLNPMLPLEVGGML